MRTSYDPEVDAFYVRFGPDSTVIDETREVAPGVMIDLEADGQLVGLEVLGVRERTGHASGVAQAVRAAE